MPRMLRVSLCFVQQQEEREVWGMLRETEEYILLDFRLRSFRRYVIKRENSHTHETRSKTKQSKADQSEHGAPSKPRYAFTAPG